MAPGTAFVERVTLFAFARRRGEAAVLLEGLGQTQRAPAEALLSELRTLDASLRHARVARDLAPRSDARGDAAVARLLARAPPSLAAALSDELRRLGRRPPARAGAGAQPELQSQPPSQRPLKSVPASQPRAGAAAVRALARALLRHALH